MGTRTLSASSAPRSLPKEPRGGQAEGELLPEAVLVAFAQVAGATVLTGVLDAGVDGCGAVFALWGRGRGT